MKIAYHYPSPYSIYAYRTIYNGFKNAFTDLGHRFLTLTADDSLAKFLDQNKPDIFITASHFYYRKYLDYQLLRQYRDRGMKMLTKIDFWNSPMEKTRVNEAPSLREDNEALKLIIAGLLGDEFFHNVEQGDLRMDGFEEATGFKYHTIPLAADKIILKGEFSAKFQSDIAYVGTNLPQKREFFSNHVFPLSKQYDLRLYGQDWTTQDTVLGWVQRAGQYFNLPYLRSLRKPKLKLEEEAMIYASSKISINVHEEYQKKFGGDCNERTFKIPFCGGFEIVDNVACIKKYFVPEKEIIIADNNKDWDEKIRYYLKNPDKTKDIVEAGKKKVEKYHTYHNRAKQIIEILKK